MPTDRDKRKYLDSRYTVTILALALVYFCGAKLGLAMAFEAEQVTVVWPPTGIALAAVVLFGYRVWPGVLLGAFLANITAHETIATASGIAIGNTLEALAAAIMLQRFAGFECSISRVRDVASLVIFSAILSTMISATVGVTSLCLGGVQPWDSYRSLWQLWWLGDATGALTFAPVLLAWGARSRFSAASYGIEFLALLGLLAIACAVIFFRVPAAGISGYFFVYLIFPFVIWASLRFGQRGATLVTLIALCIAIRSTIHGSGPFAAVSADEGLTLLQVFAAVMAMTGLLLAAAITERKRAEEDKSFLASIVQFSEDAIIGKDLNGIINFWNGGAERLYGYSSAEAIGRSSTFIVPDDRQQEETQILGRLRRGERIEHYETVRMAKDGHKIDISLTISPIRDNKGHIIGAAKVARDITEWKRAEKALKEADRHKDEFLAMLAHELRNPLAPLSNALYIVESGADAEQAAKAYAIMRRQVQQMTRLVDDLLDASRISHGKVELRKERITLAEVINSAVETVKPAIERNQHTLSVQLPEQSLWLNVDLTRLSQVFANLLNNAAKYTPPGGYVLLRAEKQENSVIVRVSDTGVGIPSAMLSRIFDLFAQVDNSIERTRGGLGIGLTLVKNLVEMHEGTVEANSKGTGQGSEFIVRLPLASSSSQNDRTDEQESRYLSKTMPERLRVLVVDDHKILAETLGCMVELLEHEVKLAHDGDSAIALAKSFLPHVILLDIGLSGMSGYEVCRQLRAQAALKDCIIVAQTGWGQEEHRQHSQAAGFDRHLVKPIKLETLERLFLSLYRPSFEI